MRLILLSAAFLFACTGKEEETVIQEQEESTDTVEENIEVEEDRERDREEDSEEDSEEEDGENV